MQYVWVSFLALLFSISSFANSPVSGQVLVKNSQYYILTEEQKTLKISDQSSPTALQDFKRLTHGDYVFAQGLLDPTDLTVTVTGIEYVGLKKLLGTWMSSRGIFQFKNFTDASFHTLRKNRKVSANLRYSTAPAAADSWVVFLTENETTLLSTIVFRGADVEMSIYQPDSGELVQTLSLKRWRR